MGAYGSGGPRELTPVEDCLVLDAGKLQRPKWLRKDFNGRGSWAW